MSNPKLFWSTSLASKAMICAIAPLLLLFSLHGQLAHALYTPNAYTSGQHHQHQAEEATPSPQQYAPVIDVAFPAGDNESDFESIAHFEPQSTRSRQPQPILSRTHREISSGLNNWTPLSTSGRASQLNSVYTAVNPPSGAPTVTAGSPYAPVYTTLTLEEPNVPTGGHNPSSVLDARNLTYLTSESISRNSYQKPSNTYMIQPAKYQQAFPNNSKINATTTKASTNNKKKATKVAESEILPIPVIKPHKHGATLGFNLPEQGLTLYLDINELTTKPMAQNIGLKVVSHNTNTNKAVKKSKKSEQIKENNINNHQDSSKLNAKQNTTSMAKILKKRVTKVITKRAREESAKASKPAKSSPIMSANQSVKTKTNVKGKTGNLSGMQSPATKAKVLDKDAKQVADQANRTMTPSASRIPASFESQFRENDVETGAGAGAMQQKKDVDANEEEKDILKGQTATTKEENKQNSKEVDEFDKEVVLNNNEEIETLDKPKAKVSENEDEEEEETDEDAKTTTESNAIGENDEEDEENDTTSTEVTSSDAKSSTAEQFQTSTLTPLNANELDDALNLTNASKKQEEIDNRLAEQMRDLIEKGKTLLEMSSKLTRTRRDMCEANLDPQDTDKLTSIGEIAKRLQADRILSDGWKGLEQELQDMLDFTTSDFTLILPSNQAVQRLPPSLLRRWRETEGDRSLTVESFIIDGKHSLESLVGKTRIMSRNKGTVFVNKPTNGTYTINGQRVVLADQKITNGGMVHVIDGLLYPNANKDIMDTLKSCGRLDGFVTLAEGTGFADMLKKDGPFTVFVPSNDALQKVPDQDLELIRRNMTALREFLKYHVASGSFYSQDLKDGQFLPSMLEGQYLQTGVRVDGCMRRLVEVNVSPLYRADIPASNGVIHVVDWILKPDDRDWCNGIILPRRK